MPIAILVTLVAAGMSTLLLTTVLQQTTMTKADIGRAHALDGANAGLELALGAIRASVDSSGDGSVTSLPCAPLTGSAGQGAATFQAQLTYFVTDPRTLSSAALATTGVTCPTSLSQVPRFARVTSTGTDPGSKEARTLFGTYTFKTPMNVNKDGGQIHVYRSPGDPDLCFDAGASPAVGTTVMVKPCLNPIAPQQEFAYAGNLNIVLVSVGLCLDAGSSEAVGGTMKLHACGTTTQAYQQWSYSPNGIIYGTNDGVNNNGLCLTVTSPGGPSTITLNNNSATANDGHSACYGSASNDNRSFLPDSKVGAGAAGTATNQLVNFLAFSRCLDVPGYNTSAPDIHIYPCKQTPNPSNLEWNEVFYLPPSGTGVIYTMPTSTSRYCLVAPPLTDPNLYVTIAVCPATGAAVPDKMTWRVQGPGAATYYERYRIETTGTMTGDCLTTDPLNVAVEVRIAPCDGGSAQKWNAEPDLVTPQLADIGEL